jgi:outer membrane protein, heavy metal efflux system
MKTILIIIIQLFLITTGYSQHIIENILIEIEKNNTALKAYKDELEAQRLGNKTGIYLPNPEFEYAWFAGSPSAIGSKTNISLRQHFDFPTAYAYRSRIANERNEQLSLEFEQQRRDILTEARLLCMDIIYHNALIDEYNKRLEHAQKLADANATMLEAGHINILDYNKGRLNLLQIQKEAEKAAILRGSLLNELIGFNGGNDIELTETNFPQIEINDDFDEWYSQIEQGNPVLKWLKQEIEISRQQEKLQRALTLPSFSGGYVSEALTHEQFRGFVVGLSIPLMENKNTVKHAQARTLALESTENDGTIQYRNFLLTQHSKAVSLQSAVNEYQTLLSSIDNTRLLNTAWEQGELSLTNYLLELAYYYQGVDNILEMKLELHKTLTEMNKYMD